MCKVRFIVLFDWDSESTSLVLLVSFDPLDLGSCVSQHALAAKLLHHFGLPDFL